MGPARCACGASAPECQSGSHGYEWRFASDTQIQGRNDKSDAVCVYVCVCVCVCMYLCMLYNN